MTPSQYRAALEELGLTQADAAHVLGVSIRTGTYYAQRGPSAPAALALQLLLALPPNKRAPYFAPAMT